MSPDSSSRFLSDSFAGLQEIKGDSPYVFDVSEGKTSESMNHPAESPSAPGSKGGKVGYGIDEPRSIIELLVAGCFSVIIGLAMSVYSASINPDIVRLALIVGPAVGFLLFAVAIALYYSSRQGKVTEMRKVVSDIPWGGDEVVLDLGCGRGLGMVFASRRLDGGYSVGVDLWRRSHLSGNDPKSIWANASEEGVQDRVYPVKADLSHLPFAGSSVDVILSATSLHRLVKRKERQAAFGEMARVLNYGGRIGIVDTGNGGDYASLLRSHGMTDVVVRRLRFSSFPPLHIVLARKPFQG
jgi:SAM-dependent methyltransferase